MNFGPDFKYPIDDEQVKPVIIFLFEKKKKIYIRLN